VTARLNGSVGASFGPLRNLLLSGVVLIAVWSLFSFSPCGRRWRGRSPCRMRGL
jgi:hypothetical protein